MQRLEVQLFSRLSIGFMVFSLMVACGDDDRRIGPDDTGEDDTNATDTAGEDVRALDVPARDTNREAEACQKMDILFVIDDSGSMQEEQANLVANFPMFVSALDSFLTESGAALDYRLGVTTTGEMNRVEIIGAPGGFFPPISEDGPNGALLQPSGCNMSRAWIERGDTDVAGTFACVAQVGTGGSSKEKPLLMTQRAISDRIADGANAGFLRDDALLAVVILTDEDDCSGTATMQTLDFSDIGSIANAGDECSPDAPDMVSIESVLASLDAVKGDRTRWASAIIAGPTDCTSAFGDAVAATRLQNFTSQVGENAVFSSICEGDLTSALTDAINNFDAACERFTPLI